MSPCQNGGTCVEYPGWYDCECAPGWTGVNCINGKVLGFNNSLNSSVVVAALDSVDPVCIKIIVRSVTVFSIALFSMQYTR